MSRYIDIEPIIDFIENRYEITWTADDYEGGIKDACTDILKVIEKQPTADVRENIKGKWIRIKDTVQCSQCKAKWIDHTYLIETFRFCPNCGADMRKTGANDYEISTDKRGDYK